MPSKKDLLYPIIVGLTVSFVVLFGQRILAQIDAPAPVPPAELIYAYSTSVIGKDDLVALFPNRFSASDDSKNSVVVSNLTIVNASGRDLKDLDIVALNRFFKAPKWVDVKVDSTDTIFVDTLDEKSIDTNGTMKIDIKKFGRNGQIEISVKSDDMAFIPELQTSREDIILKPISYPLYLSSTAPQPEIDYFLLFVTLLSSVLAGVVTYLAKDKLRVPSDT